MILALVVLFLAVGTSGAEAARIGDQLDAGLWEQAMRFLTFRDGTVRAVVAACVLLGISCGVLGSFVVVRRMAMIGDAVSHSVLPGVVIGFLWEMEKNPVAIFVGAVLAGLLGATVVRLIRQTTRIKQDAALAIVLGTFFAVGACLLDIVSRLPTAGKAGLDRFLFGQAVGISPGFLWLIVAVTVLVLAFTTLLYKELLAVSFDSGFARSVGIPPVVLHYALMLLLAFVVVVAIRAVGVVLVSALLVIPATTAYLLADRLRSMLFLASLFGAGAALVGGFLSFLDARLPTGPVMVLAAAFLFGVVFLFSRKHGVVRRWFRQRSRRERVGRENALKAIYHILEAEGYPGGLVPVSRYAEHRQLTLSEAGAELARLERGGFAAVTGDGPPADGQVAFSPTGARRAAELVRNHRLWELYLTNEADIAPDHVHDDAEKIEHILGESTVRELEAQLGFAREDPHGKPIPVPGEGGAG